MTTGLAFGVIAAVIRLLAELPPIASEIYNTNTQALRWAMLAWAIQFWFIWRFFEHLNAVHTHPWRLGPMAGLFALNASTIIGFMLRGEDQIQQIEDMYYFTFGFLAFTFSSWILFNVYHDTGKETVALIQFLAVGLIWISFPVAAAHYLVDGLLYVGNAMQLVGMFVFACSLVIDVDYIYRLPVNIQNILLHSVNGPCFYAIGHNIEAMTVDKDLLSGIIVAANKVVTEFDPRIEGERLEIVQTTDKTIEIQMGESVGVAIVASRNTYFLHHSARRLVRILEEAGAGELVKKGRFFDTETVNAWIKQVFPYLPMSRMTNY